MDRKIDAAALIVAASALLLVVALFLDWYGLGGSSARSAWEVFEVLDLVLLAAAVAAVAAAFGRLDSRVLLGAALVAVVARRRSLVAYTAGHTHRNRVRRVRATGEVPYGEVSATKDFPGAWAEYRVFEGGILQVLHRIADPAALAWTERTRAMYAGLYAEYAFGRLEDRCFPIWPR